MENIKHQEYIKRTQKDYSMSFKLQIVQEVENGEQSVTGAMQKYGIQVHGSILGWVKKFGNFDRDLYVKAMNQTKTPEQENFDLKQQIKILEKHKAFMA